MNSQNWEVKSEDKPTPYKEQQQQQLIQHDNED
jgi:hypothetical protein